MKEFANVAWNKPQIHYRSVEKLAALMI
jgi:hypothetical protein